MFSEGFRNFLLYGPNRSCPIFPTSYSLCLAEGRVRSKKNRKMEPGRRKM